eukprot:COSAG05_NODE_2009_length_3706_cov_2.105905_3_plen_139_part_00
MALEPQVISCRKLKRMDKLKQNDVYCLLSVPEVAEPRRTATIYSSMHSGIPVWPANEKHQWEYQENKLQPKTVTLQVILLLIILLLVLLPCFLFLVLLPVFTSMFIFVVVIVVVVVVFRTLLLVLFSTCVFFALHTGL